MRCSIWPATKKLTPYDTVELLKLLNDVGARYWGELPDTRTLPRLRAPPRDAEGVSSATKNQARTPASQPGTHVIKPVAACSNLKAVESPTSSARP
jgi:hypothetical protein